jgi:flagellar basal-body rod protein FlgB
MNISENPQIKFLSKALDAYMLRQKVTAGNIANIDTEGYTKKSVKFEELMRNASSHQERQQVLPSIESTGERVDLDTEMIEMSDTQMRVQMVSRLLRHQMDMVRMGITGNSNIGS